MTMKSMKDVKKNKRRKIFFRRSRFMLFMVETFFAHKKAHLGIPGWVFGVNHLWQCPVRLRQSEGRFIEPVFDVAFGPAQPLVLESERSFATS